MNGVKRFEHSYYVSGARRIIRGVVFRAVGGVLAKSEFLKSFRVGSNMYGLGVGSSGIAEKISKGAGFSKHAGIIFMGSKANTVDVSAFEVMMMRNKGCAHAGRDGIVTAVEDCRCVF